MELIRIIERKLSKNGNSYQSWGLFLCPNCLQEVERDLGRGKKQKSCGCVKYISNYKHGCKGTRLYYIWQGIKQRCLYSKHIGYYNYGGRGITICNEWLEFIPFRDWSLNNGYQEGLEIDRIDNDGSYEPSNCRWVTHEVNQNNKRRFKVTIQKVQEIIKLYETNSCTQKDLSDKYKVSQATISNIINNKQWVK